MANLFTGKYTRISSTNMEAVLEKLGISTLLRRAAGASTPVMEITEEDGKYTIKTSTIMKTMELDFRIGEEFDEVSADGRACKTLVTQEGDNKLIIHQRAVHPDQKSVYSVREFDTEGIKQTITVDDVVAVQVYKRG